MTAPGVLAGACGLGAALRASPGGGVAGVVASPARKAQRNMMAIVRPRLIRQQAGDATRPLALQHRLHLCAADGGHPAAFCRMTRTMPPTHDAPGVLDMSTTAVREPARSGQIRVMDDAGDCTLPSAAQPRHLWWSGLAFAQAGQTYRQSTLHLGVVLVAQANTTPTFHGIDDWRVAAWRH